MDVLEMLVKNLFETSYQELPANVVEATKKEILDTLGVTVGGSTCSVSDEMNGMVDLVKQWGGREESSIIAFGGKVPAPNAAFVNGTLSVRLDFDDTHDLDRDHPTRAIVSPAFAVAERRGGVGGKDFIAAVALGLDLELRVKRAVMDTIESPFGFAINFLGAAATAGKILGLNEEKLAYALGLAFQRIGGARAGKGIGGLGACLKGVNNGFAAKAGVVSALLAERGFTSGLDFLKEESKNNFYRLFYSSRFVPWLALIDLGKDFRGATISQKAYPCCRGQASALDATLALIHEHDIRPDDVDEVVPRLGVFDYSMLAEPLEKKQNPQNIIETQFSICWGVASAIVYGRVDIENFTKEALEDARVQEIARRVFPRAELAFHRRRVDEPALVEIKMKDGRVYSKQVDHPLGSPENPMSLDDVATKFRHCCQYSVKPIPKENQDKVIQMVKGLEGVEDVSEVICLLA